MKKISAIVALLLALAAPVAAQYEIKVKAHEVRLSALRLPASVSGSVAFKACDECDYMTRRVTPNTRWELNNRVVRFDDFRVALAAVRDREEHYVTVHHDLTTDLITEVAITVY